MQDFTVTKNTLILKFGSLDLSQFNIFSGLLSSRTILEKIVPYIYGAELRIFSGRSPSRQIIFQLVPQDSA